MDWFYIKIIVAFRNEFDWFSVLIYKWISGYIWMSNMWISWYTMLLHGMCIYLPSQSWVQVISCFFIAFVFAPFHAVIFIFFTLDFIIKRYCRLKRTSPTAYCDCWEKCSCRALVAGNTPRREKLISVLLNNTDLIHRTNSRYVFYVRFLSFVNDGLNLLLAKSKYSSRDLVHFVKAFQRIWEQVIID